MRSSARAAFDSLTRRKGHELSKSPLSIDYTKLAEWIIEPLEERLRPLYPEGVPPADLARMRMAALSYVSARVKQDGRKFILDAVNALQAKLMGEAIVKVLQAEFGDTADVQDVLRMNKRNVRKFATSLTNKWVPLTVGRPRARTDEDEKVLRKDLQEEIRRLRADRLREGRPSATADVLPDIAARRGMSEGTLDHILNPRKSTKRKAK